MNDIIRVEGLVKRFGETTALAGVDLAVPPGIVQGVLGPNGAGKTTLVRILATLTAPTEGRASIGGYDVVGQAHEVRQLIAVTGQQASVDDNLTGLENLQLVGRLLNLSRAEARSRAAELLEQFHLTEAAGRAVKTFSGGMRRRLDLASSLVLRPGVLFLDEPTTGLDPRSRNELWDIIRALVADGVTVLLTTQYLEEADQLAHDIVVVDHGRIIEQGTPGQLKQRVGGQTLAIRPAVAEDLTAVANIASEVLGAPAQRDGHSIVVPIADPAAMPGVVRGLDDAGIRLAELTMRESTLDEVFLALTGHRAEDDSRDEQKEGTTV